MVERLSRRDFLRAAGLALVAMATGGFVPERQEDSPFGIYDVRNFHPSVLEEIERNIAEGKTFKIGERLFVLDRWNGVLGITREKGVFYKTSLATIPDEVAEGYTSIMGINFAINPNGSVEILVANPNPGHNLPEAYLSQDGLNWEYLGVRRWEYVGGGNWRRIGQ